MRLLWGTLLSAALLSKTAGCDLCSIYFADQARGQSGQGFLAGAAEQWTHYGTLQESGHRVPNEAGQFLNSSISQVFVDYNFTDRVGLQFNLPIVYRWFKRPDGFSIQRGAETGFGDASLLGHVQVYRQNTEEISANINFLAGLKFPTGSTRRLREELNEIEAPGAVESGIHGHDLTLGSGSWDGLIGATTFARWHRLFWSANVQYSLRTEGDYGYQFANDFIWSTGPGYFVALGHGYTLGVQTLFSGETKPRDTFRGERAEDTGLTILYLGPQITFTWLAKFSAELGADLPVRIENTALQAVSDFRIRAGLSWRF